MPLLIEIRSPSWPVQSLTSCGIYAPREGILPTRVHKDHFLPEALSGEHLIKESSPLGGEQDPDLALVALLLALALCQALLFQFV